MKQKIFQSSLYSIYSFQINNETKKLSLDAEIRRFGLDILCIIIYC